MAIVAVMMAQSAKLIHKYLSEPTLPGVSTDHGACGIAPKSVCSESISIKEEPDLIGMAFRLSQM